MPTIRRPSWRPRTMHGYKVETFKTTDNAYLERDEQFKIADITEDARELILDVGWTIWFIRRPGEIRNFATLLKPVPALQLPLFESHSRLGPVRLTYDIPANATEFELTRMYYVNHANWKYSFVNGKARPYLSSYEKHLWLDVRDHLRWADVPQADIDALASVADEFSADL